VENTLRVEKEDGHRFIPSLIDAFGDRIDSVSIGKPTLEDVFVTLTGHHFWKDAE
jgi:ABC-2 type transport system ATP-binding protein